MNVKPETQNRRLDPTGLAKPGETRGLMGTGPGLAHQESAGRGFGWVWNRTDQFLRSKPGPLAGHPDPLLTLPTGPAKPGITLRLTGMGPGLSRQDTAGQVFGRVWSQTEQFFWSNPGPLACHPDPLLTLNGGRSQKAHHQYSATPLTTSKWSS